jgi:UDP-N-acetyl-D-mannosaminuronic acid dehydrogenase
MPHYVLERTVRIMEKSSIIDVSRVGFYGLTYKEDVDDVRESPTLQLLDAMRLHMAQGPKVYDPYIKSRVVSNQVFSLEEFLDGLDMVVIMVAHREIIDSSHLLKDKVVFDTRNIFKNQNVFGL